MSHEFSVCKKCCVAQITLTSAQLCPFLRAHLPVSSPLTVHFARFSSLVRTPCSTFDRLQCARFLTASACDATMMTLSRSCLPTSEPTHGQKMPLRTRDFDENDNEADLSDKGIVSLESIPKICECAGHCLRLRLTHTSRATLGD